MVEIVVVDSPAPMVPCRVRVADRTPGIASSRLAVAGGSLFLVTVQARRTEKSTT
jgi:hypothetical protein